MMDALKLLLPAIIPSWRFFDVIAPSPRIEFTVLSTPGDVPKIWQTFRPRPDHVPVLMMFRRMTYNAHWNETLFLASCAERLMQNPTKHSEAEIVTRIRRDLSEAEGYMKLRLVFVRREGETLEKCVTFTSDVYPLNEGAA